MLAWICLESQCGNHDIEQNTWLCNLQINILDTRCAFSNPHSNNNWHWCSFNNSDKILALIWFQTFPRMPLRKEFSQCGSIRTSNFYRQSGSQPLTKDTCKKWLITSTPKTKLINITVHSKTSHKYLHPVFTWGCSGCNTLSQLIKHIIIH